ncbi:hypothetical protein BDV27DRAFT_124786 [Aspergillus caelatus]|uniref:Uncharacterized protein n=1 Tax=Aspergillus caelatus TaxID=61420 RepID=A0A5N7AAY2_9EURO|nr:uncharacterized protein BDV27DRAFT_124786 [Aspergillus caelatus]KAE8366793.1 hypothetical protein BDV27DRAFT_124786 [Aspergillus caelatus]
MMNALNQLDKVKCSWNKPVIDQDVRKGESGIPIDPPWALPKLQPLLSCRRFPPTVSLSFPPLPPMLTDC